LQQDYLEILLMHLMPISK